LNLKLPRDVSTTLLPRTVQLLKGSDRFVEASAVNTALGVFVNEL
jgi:hypothetical protein